MVHIHNPVLKAVRQSVLVSKDKPVDKPWNVQQRAPRPTCRTGDAEGGAAAGAAAQDSDDAGGGVMKQVETAAGAVAAGQRHRLPLGVRNPGVAVPDAGGQPEDVLLYFGIIDILQVRHGPLTRTPRV